VNLDPVLLSQMNGVDRILIEAGFSLCRRHWQAQERFDRPVRTCGIQQAAAAIMGL
jgi:hypothetical protein